MKVTCPKCGSDQISANKKGFSGGKAVAGAIMTGGIGLLAGTIGSSKVMCTCLACGGKFKAGQGKIVYEPGEQPPAPVVKDAATMERNKRINKVILKAFLGVILAIVLIVVISLLFTGCKKNQATGRYCWHCTLTAVTGQEMPPRDTCTDTDDPSKLHFFDANNNSLNSICAPK